jgi:arginine decarboxylase-like protein
MVIKTIDKEYNIPVTLIFPDITEEENKKVCEKIINQAKKMYKYR